MPFDIRYDVSPFVKGQLSFWAGRASERRRVKELEARRKAEQKAQMWKDLGKVGVGIGESLDEQRKWNRGQQAAQAQRLEGWAHQQRRDAQSRDWGVEDREIGRERAVEDRDFRAEQAGEYRDWRAQESAERFRERMDPEGAYAMFHARELLGGARGQQEQLAPLQVGSSVLPGMMPQIPPQHAKQIFQQASQQIQTHAQQAGLKFEYDSQALDKIAQYNLDAQKVEELVGGGEFTPEEGAIAYQQLAKKIQSVRKSPTLKQGPETQQEMWAEDAMWFDLRTGLPVPPGQQPGPNSFPMTRDKNRRWSIPSGFKDVVLKRIDIAAEAEEKAQEDRSLPVMKDRGTYYKALLERQDGLHKKRLEAADDPTKVERPSLQEAAAALDMDMAAMNKEWSLRTQPPRRETGPPGPGAGQPGPTSEQQRVAGAAMFITSAAQKYSGDPNKWPKEVRAKAKEPAKVLFDAVKKQIGERAPTVEERQQLLLLKKLLQ